jgi:hypothetical protein
MTAAGTHLTARLNAPRPPDSLKGIFVNLPTEKAL